MEGYLTVGAGSSEYTEKKSVFYGDMERVTTEQEAKDFIAKISAKYPDATHHVTAYVLKADNTMRFSDAGEPSGTAGKPALEVLLKEGVKDVCLVITRYFGGIKLGAGGLVRAYAKSAKLTLDAAGTHMLAPVSRGLVACSYPDWSAVADTLKAHGVGDLTTDYGADVCSEFLLPSEQMQALADELAERTAGRVVPETLEEFLG